MNLIILLRPLICAFGFILANTLAADAAPAQLLNKTVVVNVTVNIPGKGSNGSTVNVASPVQGTIYISSVGRVFTRVNRSAGNSSSQSEAVSGGSLGMSFRGNKMVGVSRAISGASLWTVSFDPAYQSCNLQMIVGKDGGKPFTWKGLDGVAYTATGPTQVSGLSCSIRDGNALAN